MQVEEIKRPTKTLYAKVEASIREDILNQNIKPGEKLASPEEFAAKLHVSEGTVRHALQRLAAKGIITRKPRVGTFVNSEFVEPKEANGKSDFSQAQTDSNNIVLMVPRVECPDWSNLAGGLYEAVNRNNLDLVIANTEDDAEQYEKLISRYINANVYGLALGFCVRPHLKLETLLMLEKSGIPVVCLFGNLGVCGWPTVCSDIGAQAYIATKHLCEIGCKKIAYVGTDRPLGLTATEATVTQHGFMRALLETENHFYADLQFLVPDWSESSVTEKNESELSRQLGSWLDRHRDLDGVFCTSDHTAFPVIAALESLGKRVPEDVAVVGCGNLAKYHKSVAGDLTTVDICIDEIAANACDLLVAMRNGEQVAEGLIIAVEGKLLVGKSTVKK